MTIVWRETRVQGTLATGVETTKTETFITDKMEAWYPLPMACYPESQEVQKHTRSH
jgi:hypothetical protein